MALGAYFLISWFIISLFIAYPYKLTLKENLFILFISTIFIVNAFTIVSLNLGWVMLARDVEKYIAVVLYRTVMIPVSTLYAVNIFFSVQRKLWKIIKITSIYIALIGLEISTIGLGLAEYKKWSLTISALVLLMFLLFAFSTFKLYRTLIQKEG